MPPAGAGPAPNYMPPAPTEVGGPQAGVPGPMWPYALASQVRPMPAGYAPPNVGFYPPPGPFPGYGPPPMGYGPPPMGYGPPPMAQSYGMPQGYGAPPMAPPYGMMGQ
jgi:hypothetical protein